MIEDLEFETHDLTFELTPLVRRAAREVGVDLREVIERDIARIQPRLRAARTTIKFEVGQRVIPQIGMTGFTNPTNGVVSVTIDPESRIGLRETLERWVGPTIAHELHHRKRVLDGPGYGRTLREALITEGLGDSFAVEVYPALRAPWTDALTPEQENEAWAEAVPVLDDPYDLSVHGRWFFGRGGDHPFWTGYTIGYHIVQGYLTRHPDVSAAELAEVDATTILSESGYRGRAP